MATINEKVKLALRISHNYLDDEISDVIMAAKQEMKRAGVSEIIVDSQLEVVETAIKTYALAYYADPEKGAKYMESFKYQLDNIRKTSWEA